jgi:DNA-binding NtrC family response regulator
MKKLNLLIAEDETNLSKLLERVLTKEGYTVFTVPDGNSALDLIRSKPIDLVLTDIKMPNMDGIELLKQIKAYDQDIEVILMTAFATLDTAIYAMKMGARDYIRKPFDLEEVLETVNKVSLMIKRTADTGELAHYNLHDMLVTNSPPMQSLIKMVQKIAMSNANVYILGETGVGKELIAHAIHECSDRKDKPFIKVNCSALPESLLESELFGYEKGAFTGAFAKKLGRFELAQGGTIFLDEIGDISPLIQLKLLRIIQQKELERLGGVETINLDVRIITATNKDLESLVKGGQFREDLYYRLNVIPLTVPPLRERKEDLLPLIDTFVTYSIKRYKTPHKSFSDEALDTMLAYSWPGNVRELENIIERVLLISETHTIELSDLPEKMRLNTNHLIGSSDTLDALKDSTEEKIIQNAILSCDGNITKAAELLGISRRSLHRKINKHNLNS